MCRGLVENFKVMRMLRRPKNRWEDNVMDGRVCGLLSPCSEQ